MEFLKLRTQTTPYKFEPEYSAVNNNYPFGMLQPRRYWQSQDYRFGFNGIKMDNKVSLINKSKRRKSSLAFILINTKKILSFQIRSRKIFILYFGIELDFLDFQQGFPAVLFIYRFHIQRSVFVIFFIQKFNILCS